MTCCYPDGCSNFFGSVSILSLLSFARARTSRSRTFLRHQLQVALGTTTRIPAFGLRIGAYGSGFATFGLKVGDSTFVWCGRRRSCVAIGRAGEPTGVGSRE